MRLAHSSGVAKLTTVGRPARSAASRDMPCSGHATGSRVQIFLRAAGVVATGVRTGRALLPTAAGTSSATGTAPRPTALRPSRSRLAAIIQLPARGSSTWAP
jgi:hypothetical protein